MKSFITEIQITACGSIANILEDAIQLGMFTNCRVCFCFNGVTVNVRQRSIAECSASMEQICREILKAVRDNKQSIFV